MRLLSLVVAGVNGPSLSLLGESARRAGEGEFDWPNAFGLEYRKDRSPAASATDPPEREGELNAIRVNDLKAARPQREGELTLFE